MSDFFDSFVESMQNQEKQIGILSIEEFKKLVEEAKIALCVDLRLVLKTCYECPDFYISLNNSEKGTKIIFEDCWVRPKEYVLMTLEHLQGRQKFKILYTYFAGALGG